MKNDNATQAQTRPPRPFEVPVPVRAGRFVPLSSAHASLNIEVDPGALGPYRCAPAEAEPLLADLQTCPGVTVSGRLGSGRAGTYNGHYLKGVGRTPLAAPPRGSPVHHSGHLPASAALRELWVSRYLLARGLGHTIVPCTGLLFAAVPPALRDFPARAYAGCDPALVPTIDRHLIALSVKPGGFARPSNFVWLLHHLSPARLCQEHSLGTFASLLAEALCPEQDSAGLGPGELAQGLAQALHRAGSHFCAWLRAGVSWLSLSNNVTLDGRFLDLETPVITGAPFLGVLAPPAAALSGRSARSALLGTEYFSYLSQTRAFCHELTRSLRALPEGFLPIERDFAEELAAQIEARLLHPASPLCSQEAAVAVLWPTLADAFGASPHLRALLVSEHAARGLCEVGESGVAGDYQAVPGMPGLPIEPGQRLGLHADRALLRPLPPIAAAMAEHLLALDRCCDPAQVADELDRLSRTLAEDRHAARR